MAQKALEKDNHFNRKIYLLIFALVFLLYGNSIKNEYGLDDNYVTVTTPEKPNNPRIEKGIAGIPKLFTTHYIESASQSFEYRPLVLVTFAIEYQFFGSNPHVSHFISVLLYAITCMLLFTILSKLLKEYNLVFPLLIVFLFIIHPIHTEVVDNIKCRDELLSFLFGISSLYFFIKSIETNKWVFILIALAFLVMGLLCKRTAMLFMALIPLTIYFFTSIKLKRIVILGLVLFITFFIYDSIKSRLIHSLLVQRDFVFFENPLYYEHGFMKRIPLAFYTMGYYLKLLIFPYPLSCYYGYNTIPMQGWSSPWFILSAILYFSMAMYAFIKLPKKRVLSFAMLVFLGGIFPVSNTISPVAGIIGERFIYFASFGFCIAAAYLILKLCKVDIKAGSKFKIQGLKFSFKLTLTGILILFSSLTIARNTKWKDKLTLYRNDVKCFENSYFLHYFITQNIHPLLTDMPMGYKRDALISEMQTHYKQAAELLRVGLEEYKTDYFTMTTLGTIYNNQLNDVDAALPYFKKSLNINPKYDVTRFNLILCYEKKNQPDSAIILYEKMIAANTTYPPVYFNLHELYINKHEYLKAINCDEKAIKQCPTEYKAKAYINLGNAYMLNKDTLNGIIQFEKAVELEPQNTNMRTQIVTFLKSAGYTERADKLNKK